MIKTRVQNIHLNVAQANKLKKQKNLNIYIYRMLATISNDWNPDYEIIKIRIETARSTFLRIKQ